MKKIVIGILAHVDSGKTTLTEGLMYLSGNLRKHGRVDHQDSFLDTDTLERERGITIFSKQAIMPYRDTEFTILDTPGHTDFSAEAERTLQVLDYAILVISGSEGVQSHTTTLWKLLQRYQIPCFIFINKMDLVGANAEETAAELKNQLSENCVDFSEADQQVLFENLALCDDNLLQEYDQTGQLEISHIRHSIACGNIYPYLSGSALKLTGISEFLEMLYNYTAMPVYGKDFGARVFKIAQDPQGMRLTFMKITGGQLCVRDMINDHQQQKSEKVTQIRVYSGTRFTAPEMAPAGTVCAVTGLNFAASGDGLGAETNNTQPLLTPVLTFSPILPPEIDPYKAYEQFKILESEDPQLNVLWDEHNKRISLHTMGEMQLEILQKLIQRRFGYLVEFDEGCIIYKETLAEKVVGLGHFEPLRHYAEVHLLMRPGKRNSGIKIYSECREDQLDKNWQRLILSQLYDTTPVGVLTGSPVTDIEIVLTAGKAHIKHTEGGDFRQAAYRAVRQGLRSAKCLLLEPYYEFTLMLPSENIGRAISDIQHMSGTFDPPETSGENTILHGKAPVSEMRDYHKQVIQYTHGKGQLSCCFSGYEPCHNSDEIVAQIGYDPDRDIEHPCDSVFCSHGAGQIIPWDQVSQHIHVPETVLSTPATSSGSSFSKSPGSSKKTTDSYALEKDLMEIFERTYGPIRPRQIQQREIRTAPAEKAAAPVKQYKSLKNNTEYLLVDGYNVIFAWDQLKKLATESIDAARNALVQILCNYRGYKPCELILVFDAYKVPGNQREIEKYHNINIVYTKEAETADMYIEKVTHTLAKKHRVRVVTSDRLEQIIILGNGALRVSSSAFLEEVLEVEREIRDIIDN